MLKKIILVVVVIGLLGGAYGYFFMYNKSHPDYEQLEAEINVSANDLFHACRDEGLSSKYTGKLLEITGIPNEVEVHDSLSTLVFVFDEGMFGPEGVRVTFLSHYNDQIQHLSLNKEIRIKAYCTGFNETDVILEKASLVNEQ
ncbi:MAG: hypothetical protein GQ527_12285 [Bacteroidales bacterium]|nr:hypothetical protein [Bacteroidales bacterium]